ncbi:MAG: hypothetical protein ACRC6T_01650 [Sarcina sp.]
MFKKLAIFIIVVVLGISFIGVKRVNIEKLKKRGLTEVFSEIKYDDKIDRLKKELNKEDTISDRVKVIIY